MRRHADHIHAWESDCEDVELSEELEDILPIPVTSEPASSSLPLKFKTYLEVFWSSENDKVEFDSLV